jgi:DNA invertase Pin-like site-specific DNA recombinase
MIYGYAHISTDAQDLAGQRTEIQAKAVKFRRKPILTELQQHEATKRRYKDG